MSKELIICYAGEPLGWLDEVAPDISVTVYDTGCRWSKHGFWSELARRTGVSLHQLTSRGHHGHGDMLASIAAWAEQRERLVLIRNAIDVALRSSEGIARPSRLIEWVQVPNDPALRETAQWLEHICRRAEAGHTAEVLYFAHGWPFDHCGDFLARLNGPAEGAFAFMPPTGEARAINEEGIFAQCCRLAAYVGCSPPSGEGGGAQTRWSSGTQFCARSELLSRRDAAWWRELLAFSHTLGPRSAESYERIWHAILNQIDTTP